jgi:hypothetical protein
LRSLILRYCSKANGRAVTGLGGLTILAIAAIAVLRPPTPEDNRIRWSKMVWASSKINGQTVEHAALMAEAELDGSSTPVLMQLDLGTYWTVMYNSAYANLGIKSREAQNGVLMSGTIANRHFRDETFGFRTDVPKPARANEPPLLGTIGSRFFEHRILVLDFVAQRLAILGKHAALPPGLQRGIEYLPAEFTYGHLVVTATVNGRVLPNAIFDTGSSMFPFFTGHKRWTELTHRQVDDPANSTVRVNSWGKGAVLIGAPVQTLCIASACISHPTIYCEGSRLPNLDIDRSPFSGIFGNVPFDGRFTVIVDIPGRRFGLIKGSVEAPGNEQQ